jgi:hypothetical protein
MEKLFALLAKLSSSRIPVPLDKQAHFVVGAVAGLFGYLILGYYSLILVAIIAAVKEAYDYLHKDIHTCDFFDFLATVLGGAFSLLIIALLTF